MTPSDRRFRVAYLLIGAFFLGRSVVAVWQRNAAESLGWLMVALPLLGIAPDSPRFHPELFEGMDEMFVEDEQETATCREMAKEAGSYIEELAWCEGIEQQLVGFCYPGIIGAFAFRVLSTNPSVPQWVWVVVGDLPTTYFDADEAPTAATVLRRYVGIMGHWIDAVRGRVPFDDDVVQLQVPATEEFATLLEQRLEFLKREIVPELDHASSPTDESSAH